MIFEDRQEAARLLAERLAPYRDVRPLVLAIPRGAVPMATLIANELQTDVSLILVHKIPAPGFSEYAVGSVGLSGAIYKNPEADLLGIPEDYIQREARSQLEVLRERARDFHLDQLPTDYKDRVVVIVDDGIATGSTVEAAIREARSKGASKVVVAAAVAPPSTAHKIRGEADDLVLLDEPEDFFAVGQFFADFPQVEEEEVIADLEPFAHGSTRARGAAPNRDLTDESKRPRP